MKFQYGSVYASILVLFASPQLMRIFLLQGVFERRCPENCAKLYRLLNLHYIRYHVNALFITDEIFRMNESLNLLYSIIHLGTKTILSLTGVKLAQTLK